MNHDKTVAISNEILHQVLDTLRTASLAIGESKIDFAGSIAAIEQAIAAYESESVAQLGLSQQTSNQLLEQGILTLTQLDELDDSQLLRLFGRRIADELKSVY